MAKRYYMHDFEAVDSKLDKEILVAKITEAYIRRATLKYRTHQAAQLIAIRARKRHIFCFLAYFGIGQEPISSDDLSKMFSMHRNRITSEIAHTGRVLAWILQLYPSITEGLGVEYKRVRREWKPFITIKHARDFINGERPCRKRVKNAMIHQQSKTRNTASAAAGP